MIEIAFEDEQIETVLVDVTVVVRGDYILVDEDGLIDRLDDCVLTDAEMNEDWNAYSDPFEPEDRRELALANQ